MANKTLKEFMTEGPPPVADQQKESGVYIGVKFSKSTVDAIREYVYMNDIENPLPALGYHTTLIYSRVPMEGYIPSGKLNPIVVAGFDKFEVWPARHLEGNKNCLIMKLVSPWLTSRHNFLMGEYNAQYDFPNYLPHVTLSYDCGNDDAALLNRLPEFESEIEIVREYTEELN